MGKFIDLTGRKCNMLTVISRAENKNGRPYWNCRCECGNEIVIDGYSISKGITKSCGCLNDLAGKRFGKLTVIRKADKSEYPSNLIGSAWLCQCDCGNTKVVSRNNLMGGTKSCGCLVHEPRERKPMDLTGQRFGRLIAVENVGKRNDKDTLWKCQCDCGNIITVPIGHLRGGHTKSCGCLKNKHHVTNRRIFQAWKNMIDRCENPNGKDAKHYYEKGIKVCAEWHTYQNFEKWALSHGYADNLTIDRIDGDKDYCPLNCRWITLAEQQRNKENNLNFTYNGETKCLSEWAREFGIATRTLNDRIYKLGYSFEEAVSKKPRINKNSVIVEYKGKEMSITQLAEELNVSISMVSKRLKRGFSVEEIAERSKEMRSKRQ